MKKNVGLGLLFLGNLGAMGVFYAIVWSFFALSGMAGNHEIGSTAYLLLGAAGILTIVLWVAFYFAAARTSKGWLIFFLVWLVLLMPVCFAFPILLLLPCLYLTGVIMLWNATIPVITTEKGGKLVFLLAFIPTLYVTVMLAYELVIYVFDIVMLIPVTLVILSWIAVWKVSQNPASAWGYYFAIPFLLALWGLLNSFRTLGIHMFAGASMIPYIVSLALQVIGYGLVVYLIWKRPKA